MFETVLSCRIGTFTVDTSAVKVTAVAEPAGIPCRLIDPAGKYKAQPKDNILFLSSAISLPYCFSQADDRLSVTFSYYKFSNATYYPVEEIGKFGRLWHFSENVEIDLNAFWPWNNTNLAAETYTEFRAQLAAHPNQAGAGNVLPEISMLNCPAALHESIQPIFSFVKIRHSLELLA